MTPPAQDFAALIRSLIEEEGRLRAELSTDPSETRGGVDLEERRERLRQVQRGLDECWDMLRLRRAEQVAGEAERQA